MKLTAKLVSVFLLGIFALAGLRIYLAVEHEEREFEKETTAEVERLGRAMEEMIAVLWHQQGSEEVVRFVQKTNADESRFTLRWVYLDPSRENLDRPGLTREVVQAILSDQRPTIHTPDADGVMCVRTYRLVKVDGLPRGGLEFSKSIAELRQNKWDTVYRSAWIAVAMAGLAVLLVTFVGVRLVGRPTQLLVEKTRRIAAGDLSGPVHLRSRDELSELAESINEMCDRLADSQQRVREEAAGRIKAVEQLRHADRLRTVGRLAAGIAHELGTPLNVVSGRAGLIASGKLSEDEIVQSAHTIKSQADRMTAIIRQLLDFARRKTPHRTGVDLRQVAGETVKLLSGIAGKRNVELEVAEPETPLTVSVDVGQMQQVLTNLLMNAIQAMPDGGRVEMGIGSTRCTRPDEPESDATDHVCITVKDNGPGIPAEHLDQIFEPFFTTKDVGEGTGLGLSIVHGIVEEHGGWIDVASDPGQGTCFSIYLPKEQRT